VHLRSARQNSLMVNTPAALGAWRRTIVCRRRRVDLGYASPRCSKLRSGTMSATGTPPPTGEWVNEITRWGAGFSPRTQRGRSQRK